MKRSEWVLVFQLVIRGEALEYLDTLIKFKMMVMMIMMMMMMTPSIIRYCYTDCDPGLV